MFLSFEEIRGLSTGWLSWQEDGEGLILSRFTKEQLCFYDNNPATPKASARQRHSASVTLDFYTDSEYITLTADGSRLPEVGNYGKFDFLENGILVHHADCDETEDPEAPRRDAFPTTEMTVSLSPGENRVTVYLPWGTQTRIRSLELSEGAAFRPYRHAKTLLAFGDSITHGSRAVFPSMTYISQLARLLDARVVNHGIGGERFRKEKLAPGTYPPCDLVTVALGTNDYGVWQDWDEFCLNMSEFLRIAAAEFAGIPVFVILPIWREEETQPRAIGTLPRVRERIRQEAEKYPGLTVVDGLELVPHLPDFFADSPALHPNDLGFSQYAMNLYRIIRDKI